jgi:hypothetical protein
LTQTSQNIFYFALFLKDNLDEENKSNLATSSTTLPEDLCNKEPTPTTRNTSIRILFSEIRIIEGTSTVGEYIELYNPNDFEVNLTDWRIEKINSKGNLQPFIAKSKFNNITIKPFSYLLLVNSSTLETIATTPDIVYALSYNLTNNNGLRLIDKDNKIVDEVCWGKIDNYSNCKQDNPPDSNLSLNRKKTKNSTRENILNEYVETNNGRIYLGNAYDTDNSNEDFIYAPINPENSSITRPTIKDIQNFQVTNQGKIYNFSWFSPAYYDENLSYELLISTSSTSTFQTIASATFKILENQSLSLNLCNLNIASGTDLYFRLNLLNDNQILKTASTLAKMIDCNDFNLNFALLEYKTFFERRPIGFGNYVSVIVGITWKYKLLENVSLNKIRIDFSSMCGGFPFSYCVDPFNQLSVKILKINPDDSITTLFDSSSQSHLGRENLTLIIEPQEPMTIYKEDQISINIRSYELTPARNPVFEGEVLP